MSHALFQYPKNAEVGQVIPKSKIYDKASPGHAVRDKFVSQVDKIIWQYKLSPETINLSSRPNVPEIEIFSIYSKTNDLSEDVLRCIDQAIPLPIYFQVIFESRIKCVAAYKRPSDADVSKWVTDDYFETPWQLENSERIALPFSLNLEGIYEQMMFRLIAQSPRPRESLKELVARLKKINITKNEYSKIETHLLKEKQFNRKVELNAKLKIIKKELEILSS